MSIKKVWIAEECTACGLCEKLCSEVLQVKNKAIVNEGVDYSGYENLIKCIAECCPAEVIKYSEHSDLIITDISVYKRNRSLLHPLLTGCYMLN